ncbi:hypothetical protein [Streptomyces anulatus]|uniref:hypothetical protein n=1 Tax=Streptomyces anulatus TaxID=1892 RepID=UPI003F49DB5F
MRPFQHRVGHTRIEWAHHLLGVHELAALHGITRIESAVTQRRTKRAGPLPAPLAEKRAGVPSGRAAAQ